jgi:hypothetical protein
MTSTWSLLALASVSQLLYSSPCTASDRSHFRPAGYLLLRHAPFALSLYPYPLDACAMPMLPVVSFGREKVQVLSMWRVRVPKASREAALCFPAR